MRIFYLPKARMTVIILILAILAVSSFAYALTEDEKKFWQKDGNVIWQVKTDEKVVAITFEDGPDAKLTPAILDLLKEHKAKATFFVVGYKSRENPDLLQRIKGEGHEIENHSMTHPNLLKLPSNSIESQIRTADITIERIINKKPAYFRPPQGKINQQLVNIVKKRGQKIVLWSLTSIDFPYSGILPPNTTIPDLIPSGSIITLKDDDNYKQDTMKALYFLLVALSNEKYKFVTIDELLNLKDAAINEEITKPKANPNLYPNPNQVGPHKPVPRPEQNFGPQKPVPKAEQKFGPLE